MKNILLTIAYDGSRFHGWQRQPNDITVQGFLEQTLSRLFRREIRLEGTSRTDAGVHALGQRATLRTDIGIPTDRLAKVVNNALCGREEGPWAVSPVRILKAEEKPEGFHARFDAAGKKYIYRLSSGPPDVFRRNYVYFTAQKQAGSQLDVCAMQQAARALTGTRDFKSFESAGGNPRLTTVRTIFGARVISAAEAMAEAQTAGGPEKSAAGGPEKSAAGGPEGSAAGGPEKSTAGGPEKSTAGGPEKSAAGGPEKSAAGGPETPASEYAARLGMRPEEILFEVSGDGFLYNMVRIITGTLVEIGQGKRAPEEMKDIIAAADRTAAGHTAPPYGLYLAEVYYGESSNGQQTQLG